MGVVITIGWELLHGCCTSVIEGVEINRGEGLLSVINCPFIVSSLC